MECLFQLFAQDPVSWRVAKSVMHQVTNPPCEEYGVAYAALMIKSFQHKGLRLFHETGSTRGIRVDHARRLARMLSFMEQATIPGDLDFPGWRLHSLKGDLADYWSLSVSGNWRVIFKFDGIDVELVDYLDYH